MSIAYADTTTIPIDKKQDSIMEKDNLVIIFFSFLQSSKVDYIFPDTENLNFQHA